MISCRWLICALLEVANILATARLVTVSSHLLMHYLGPRRWWEVVILWHNYLVVKRRSDIIIAKGQYRLDQPMWCLAILWSTSHQVSTWESTLQKVTQGRLNWNGCWEVARGWSLIYTVVSRCKTRCNRGDYLIILQISCGEKVCACCTRCSAVRNRDWILLVSSLDLLLSIIFIHLDWWMWLLL